MKLSMADFVVVGLYAALLLFLGFYVSSRQNKKKSGDFILAGRQLTLPFFVASLVATWYGNILGVGEFVYRNGLVTWICFGLPYYISAFLFAVFAAKKIRNLNVSTIPEQITKKYGQTAGIIASVIVLVISIPAPYILMLGVIIQIFWGVPLWICIVAGSVLSLAYLFTGGFRADVITNTAQFVLMFAGFALLSIFAYLKFGSVFNLAHNLPPDHLKIFGTMKWQIIFVWFVISFQTFVDPSFHQRCSAAKTAETAKKSILVSILFWMIFDSMTLLCGLYARANFAVDNPMLAFPTLGLAILPDIWRGFFMVSLMAIIMSALDSYSLLSGITIGNDILSKIFKADMQSQAVQKRYNRIGLGLSSVFAVAMAIALPSAVQLIYKTASIAVPGLLLPLLISYSKKDLMAKKKIILLMLLSSTIALIWTILSQYPALTGNSLRHLFESVEPMVAGLIVSVLLFLLFKNRKRYVDAV